MEAKSYRSEDSRSLQEVLNFICMDIFFLVTLTLSVLQAIPLKYRKVKTMLLFSNIILHVYSFEEK